MNDRLQRLKRILDSIQKTSECRMNNTEKNSKLNGFLTARDLYCLSAPNFLNDNVLLFFLYHLSSHLPNVLVFDTFFYPSVIIDGEISLPSIDKWTKKMNLQAKNLFLIPINLYNHWITIIATKKQQNFHFFY